MSYARDIAENVKKLRHEKGLTKLEVASAMGIHLSLYSRLESGKNKVSLVAIAKVAKVFEVTTDKIIFGHDVPAGTPVLKYPNKQLVQKVKELESINQEEKKKAIELLDLLIIKSKLDELEANRTISLERKRKLFD